MDIDRFINGMNIDRLGLYKWVVDELYTFARGNAQHGESSGDVHPKGEHLYLCLRADDGEEHNEYSVFVKIDLITKKVRVAEYQGYYPEDTPKTARISYVYEGLRLTQKSINALVEDFKAWGDWREIVANEIAQEQED